jgi:hypothetical protein
VTVFHFVKLRHNVTVFTRDDPFEMGEVINPYFWKGFRRARCWRLWPHPAAQPPCKVLGSCTWADGDGCLQHGPAPCLAVPPVGGVHASWPACMGASKEYRQEPALRLPHRHAHV